MAGSIQGRRSLPAGHRLRITAALVAAGLLALLALAPAAFAGSPAQSQYTLNGPGAGGGQSSSGGSVGGGGGSSGVVIAAVAVLGGAGALLAGTAAVAHIRRRRQSTEAT